MRMMVATPAAVAADTAVILVPATVAAGDVGAIGVLGVLVDRLVVVAVLGIAVLVVVVATMLLAVAVVTMLAVVHLPKVAGSCAVESTGRPPRPVRQDQETRSAPLVHPPDRQPRHACLSLPGMTSNLGAPARVSPVCPPILAHLPESPWYVLSGQTTPTRLLSGVSFVPDLFIHDLLI